MKREFGSRTRAGNYTRSVRKVVKWRCPVGSRKKMNGIEISEESSRTMINRVLRAGYFSRFWCLACVAGDCFLTFAFAFLLIRLLVVGCELKCECVAQWSVNCFRDVCRGRREEPDADPGDDAGHERRITGLWTGKYSPNLLHFLIPNSWTNSSYNRSEAKWLK
jgi:hypothetical protein